MIKQNHIFIMNHSTGNVSDDTINTLYNACDIGINTCVGEGFGLCNMEHAGLGKPQIVSAVGALNDIFNNPWSKLIKPVAVLSVSNHVDGHGGDMHICNSDDFANAMQYYWKEYSQRIRDGIELEKYIQDKYNWDNILLKFNQTLYKICNIVS
jgi:glycosyltransferase involved in cell wall biosynthesis